MRHSHYPESSGPREHERRLLFEEGENQRAMDVPQPQFKAGRSSKGSLSLANTT